jgi:hypothetical protein
VAYIKLLHIHSSVGTEKNHINSQRIVGFEVLTAVSTKISVFWVVAPCSLVEV